MAVPAYSFYTKFLENIQETLNIAITDNLDGLIPWLTPIVRSLLIIYVAIWGIQNLMGTARSPLTASFLKLIKVAFIVMFALKSAEYNGRIVDLIMNGPDQISAALSGGAAVGASSLDQTMSKGLDMAEVLFNEAGVTNIAPFFQGLLLLLGVVLATLYAAFLLILSKVALCVMLSLGPIFIVSALFESTKKWFDAWISQVFNFSLLMLLVYIVLNIGMSFFTNAVSSMSAATAGVGVDWSATSQLCILSWILVLVFKQLPGFASALSGGFQLVSRPAGLPTAAGAVGEYAADRTAAAGSASAVRQARPGRI